MWVEADCGAETRILRVSEGNSDLLVEKEDQAGEAEIPGLLGLRGTLDEERPKRLERPTSHLGLESLILLWSEVM